jgi:hypothetical protein
MAGTQRRIPAGLGRWGEDAVRAGPGAKLQLTIAAHTADGFVRAQRQFARRGKRGVLVTIQRDDGLAPPPLPFTADRAVEPQQIAVTGADPTLTDPLLDQLTGARTTVTVTGYAGGDPWQADDLIARVGHSQDGDERALDIASSATTLMATGDPSHDDIGRRRSRLPMKVVIPLALAARRDSSRHQGSGACRAVAREASTRG